MRVGLQLNARQRASADPFADLVIAIHTHCTRRSDDAGPQGKIYLDDNTAFTADSRSTAQAVAFVPVDGRNAFEVRELTPVEQQALQGFPAGYPAAPYRQARARARFQELRGNLLGVQRRYVRFAGVRL